MARVEAHLHGCHVPKELAEWIYLPAAIGTGTASVSSSRLFSSFTCTALSRKVSLRVEESGRI